MDISSNIIYYTDAYLHGFRDISESKDNLQRATGALKVATYILSVGILPLLAYIANSCASLSTKKIDEISIESTNNPEEEVKEATNIIKGSAIPTGNSVSSSSQKGLDSSVSSRRSGEDPIIRKGSESGNLEPKSTEDSVLEDGEEPRSSTSTISNNLSGDEIKDEPLNKIDNEKDFLNKLDEWAKNGTPVENREKAKEEILKAYLSSASYLDLKDLKLKSLPENIGRLTDIKKILLSRNQLTYLPDSIGNLTALEELDLSDNRLSQLPNSIGNGVNLSF